MAPSIAHEPRVIIAVDVDTEDIEHRSDVDDMCGSWQNESHPLHDELRSSIWWAASGGHCYRSIYCGKLKPYRIVFTVQPDEFREKAQDPGNAT